MEDPRDEVGEVAGVAGRGDEPGGDPVAELGEEAPVARDPDLPEEGGPVGLGEQRREGGEEAFLRLGRRFDAVRIDPVGDFESGLEPAVLADGRVGRGIRALLELVAERNDSRRSFTAGARIAAFRRRSRGGPRTART